MTDAVFKRASRFWSEAKVGERPPARRDLDLGAAGAFAAHVILTETSAGSRHRRLFEGEMAAALLNGGNAPTVDAWRAGLDMVRATGAPHGAILPGPRAGGLLRALYLPVLASRDDRTAGCVLSVLAAVSDEDAEL